MIIVSHDAGGAEILSSWVNRNIKNKYNISYLLEGPAVKIFTRKLGISNIIDRVQFKNLLNISEVVITSTSWQSDLENFAILSCKNINVKVISFLDHWVNYEKRFIYQNKLILPNSIWVPDENAFKIASGIFQKTEIKIISNPYFLDIKDDFSKYKKLDSENKNKNKYRQILYCSEPISEHSISASGNSKYLLGYDEYDIFNNFIITLLSKFKSEGINLKIRLHPSDKEGKYDFLIKKYSSIYIQYSLNDLLIDDIFESDIIVGCETMALAVGVILGKKVLSCIPNREIFRLPFKEIFFLNEIDNIL